MSEQIEANPAGRRAAKIKVRFDQQQLKLIDFLKTEGTFGKTDGEIVRNVVIEFLKQKETGK
jgi:hypothetical protein